MLEIQIDGKTGFEDNDCPNCGLHREEWLADTGYLQKGQTYCCAPCAKRLGCDCQMQIAVQVGRKRGLHVMVNGQIEEERRRRPTKRSRSAERRKTTPYQQSSQS